MVDVPEEGIVHAEHLGPHAQRLLPSEFDPKPAASRRPREDQRDAEFREVVCARREPSSFRQDGDAGEFGGIARGGAARRRLRRLSGTLQVEDESVAVVCHHPSSDRLAIGAHDPDGVAGLESRHIAVHTPIVGRQQRPNGDGYGSKW